MAEAGGHKEARFRLIAEQFNEIVVATIAWDITRQGGEDSYDFSVPDWYIRKFAKENDLAVTAMHLAWGNEQFLPDWLKNGDFSREKLIEIMQDHIRAVVSRYKGQVRAWVVVNEASEPTIFWNKRVGPEYVEVAFQTARETDPNAILIYNDFGHEIATLPKSDTVFNLVKTLKDKGLVDAVGMQMHVTGSPNIDPREPPTKEQILEQMRRYGDLGLKVFVTELDVDIGKLPGTQEEKLAKQTEIYRTVVEACLESSGICKDIIVWGVNDEDSWVIGAGGEAPLLFSNYVPKPAYFAVLEVLQTFYAQGRRLL